MSKPVSVDFQFSIKQQGRGAKKRIVEDAGQSDDSKTKFERIPRISRYMALAIHYEQLIREGHVLDFAELARLGHVTRARVTQIMNLRLLAPDIQEALLCQPMVIKGQRKVCLRDLQLVSSACSWDKQRSLWKIQTQDNVAT